jgi:pyridoxine/pyridoxamine 5'-phosphate oxidase
VTKADLYTFMSRHKLGVLSTAGPTGDPQSALVGIAVTPDLEIVFDTVDTTRKYPNLIANHACSFVVGWETEQTVQYEGLASELTGDQLAKYKKVYFHVWPDGPSRESWPGIVYLVVRPTWVRYSDFAKDPPQIEELSFRDDS